MMSNAAEGSHLEPQLEEQRDDDLYFDDGNVVLAAPAQDGSQTYFRVHKSLLTRYSSVFRDMFSLPPPSDLEKYDSMPLVCLTDSAGDVRAFLKSLYDICFLPFNSRTPETIMSMAGPLRLATKYQVDGLRSRIIEHIEELYPLDLARWSELETSAVAESSDSDVHRLVFAAQALRLGMDCDVPNILPAAFYNLLAHVCLPTESRAASRIRGLLTPGEFERLGRAQRTLSRHYTRTAMWDVEWKCDHACGAAWMELWLRALGSIADSQDPIAVFWNECTNTRKLDLPYLFCTFREDKLAMEGLLQESAKTLWRALPEAFDLHGVQTTA